MDVGGGGRTEEDRGAGQVVGLAPASGGDAIHDGPIPLGIAAQGGRVVGGDVARHDGVDVDSLAGPFIGQRHGEPADRSLACRVARHGDAALERQQRGDEDDLSVAAFEHLPAKLAAENELGVEVDLHDAVPILVRVLGGRLAEDGSGVVDQDVDSRKVGLDPFDEAIQRTPIGKVAGVSPKPASQRDHFLLDLAAGRFHRSADADDVGPGLGQCPGNRAADPPAAAGHQREPAVESELFQNGHLRLTLISGRPDAAMQFIQSLRNSPYAQTILPGGRRNPPVGDFRPPGAF